MTDLDHADVGHEDGACVLLMAPVPMHDAPEYRAALETIRRRHPGAEVVPDVGLWDGLADWKDNWKGTLSGIAPTDLYVLTAPDGTLGRGIHTMYLLLSRSGVRCRAALFPGGEELQNFALRVLDFDGPDDWKRYCVPVAA